MCIQITPAVPGTRTSVTNAIANLSRQGYAWAGLSPRLRNKRGKAGNVPVRVRCRFRSLLEGNTGTALIQFNPGITLWAGAQLR
jgi:hypothetical protein